MQSRRPRRIRWRSLLVHFIYRSKCTHPDVYLWNAFLFAINLCRNVNIPIHLLSFSLKITIMPVTILPFEFCCCWCCFGLIFWWWSSHTKFMSSAINGHRPTPYILFITIIFVVLLSPIYSTRYMAAEFFVCACKYMHSAVHGVHTHT